MRSFSYHYVAPAATPAATIEALLEASSEHSFATLVGQNGLIQIHRSSWGDIGCVFMRDRVVLHRRTCNSLTVARAWLAEMVPTLGALRTGETP